MEAVPITTNQNTSSSRANSFFNNEETPQFIPDPENIPQLEDVQVQDLSKPSLVFTPKHEDDEKVFDHQPYDNASSSVDVNKEADEYYDEEDEEYCDREPSNSFLDEKQLYDEMI